MSDNEQLLAVLEERLKSTRERVVKLENNQRWQVLTILALLASFVFDYLGGLAS